MVLLGSLAGCTSGSGTPTTTESGTDDGGSDGGDLTTYTHGTYGYSLRFPSTWSVREDVVLDDISFSAVIDIPGEGDEIGRIYVNDIPDAHPRNNVVEEFVAASTDRWDTVEVGEVVIADGRTLPVATVSTADYLQIRWLSVMAGTNRFDLVPAVWMEALTPALSASIDAALRSFAPPEEPLTRLWMSTPPAVVAAFGAGAGPLRTQWSGGRTDPELRTLAERGGRGPAALDACEAHEERLREINAESRRLDGAQATHKRGFDSALDGLLNRFEETSGQGLPGLNHAFQLIVVLCNLVGSFMAGHNALRDEQRAVSDQRVEAAGDLRECRRDNPDSVPGRPSGEITGLTRDSITLDIGNVPMDTFALRFLTDDGEGPERLEHVGPLDAPDGRFTGTITFGDHGFSTENKKVRFIMVLIPVEGSGSDRPATALTSVLDPYGDYAD